eukprot:4834930-Amphidinium_carterae.1
MLALVSVGGDGQISEKEKESRKTVFYEGQSGTMQGVWGIWGPASKIDARAHPIYQTTRVCNKL